VSPVRRTRQVSPTTWILVPAAAAFGASLLLATPLRVAGLQLPEPVFAFVPAFAWALGRPSLAAPVALIVLGVALDLLWATPTGLWAICLLVAYALTFFSRRFLAGQEVWALWAAYALNCAAAMLVGFVLIGFRAGEAPSLVGVGLQLLVSVALFPFVWRLIERFEAATPGL
jgi:rod shape-determining protein MreD